MAPDTSFIVVTWTVIALLAFGLAGCLRAIRTLSIRIDDRFESPRRVQVGDELMLPPTLRDAARGRRYVALLFVTASCSVCTTAVDALRGDAERLREVAVQVLWSDDPPSGYEHVGLAYQSEVFTALRVPITPLLVVADTATDTVVTRGLLGSHDELERGRDTLRRLDAPHADAHDHDDQEVLR